MARNTQGCSVNKKKVSLILGSTSMMMRTQEYILFIKESLNIIRKASDENRLAIFLGAGMSQNVNGPSPASWKELIKKMAEEMGAYNFQNDFSEYIRIAQKYYLRFGQQKYIQLIKSMVLTDADPKELYRKLFLLHPRYIITTNFDDLLEKAIKKWGLNYEIVCCDDELCQVTNDRLIIKMHGDLRRRNIVFKEEDYLNYSENFPLIENFIKGIFSTCITVFIGYSLSDYNLNQILSWINLKTQNMPPIYLIQLDKEFDFFEYEYYKNKNVFLLSIKKKYLEHFFDEECFRYKGSLKAELLEAVLNYCITPGSKPIKKSELWNHPHFLINAIYEVLEPLDNFQTLLPIHVIDLLKEHLEIDGIAYGLYGNKYLYIQDKDLIRVLKNIDPSFLERRKELIPKLKFIKKILVKAKIEGFVEGIANYPPFCTLDIKAEKNYDEIFLFDFKSQNKIIEEAKTSPVLTSNPESSEKVLKASFYCYQQNRYKEAEQLLSTLFNLALKDKKYILAWRCNFNELKLYFLKSIEPSEEREKSKEEIYDPKKREFLEELFYSLPRSKRRSLTWLISLNEEEFLYKFFYELSDKSKKIEQAYPKLKENILSFDYFFEQLNLYFELFFDFVYGNYLMIEHYKVFKDIIRYYIEGFFWHIMRRDLQLEEQRPLEFLYFLAFLIVKHLNFDTIHKIFEIAKDRQKFFLKISNDEWDSFKKALDNLLKILKNYNQESWIKKTFWERCLKWWQNFILFLSNIEGLTEEQLDYVLKTIKDLVSQAPLDMLTYQAISYFFTKHYNFNKDKINKNLLEEIFFAFLKRFYCVGMNLYDIESAKKYFMFYNICYILRKIEPGFVFNSKYNFAFKSFLDWLNDLNVQSRQPILIYIIMPAYKSCRPEIKEKIEILSKNTFCEDINKTEELSFWNKGYFAYEKIILGLQMLETGILEKFCLEEKEIFKKYLQQIADPELLNNILAFIEEIKIDKIENELNCIKDKIKKYFDEVKNKMPKEYLREMKDFSK